MGPGAEAGIRTLADALFRRADWRWAQDRGETVTHGWTPERGFLKHRWQGYDEALLLYVLGLGSPTHPLPPSSYTAWTATFRWEHCYGYDYLYAGPLFIHQLSHVWIDFRGLQDAFMRSKGSDENIQLEPPRELTLEAALEYIEDDELIEVTPKSIRLRKRFLGSSERKRLSREAKRERERASM